MLSSEHNCPDYTIGFPVPKAATTSTCFTTNANADSQRRLCDSCLAQNSDKCDPAMSFRNFSDTAAYPATFMDTQTFRALGGTSDWDAMEGWNLENTTFDFMHNIYLGGGRDLLGSLLAEMELGATPTEMDSALSHIQSEMISDCRKRKFLGSVSFEVYGVV